jgi:hypothetical protein
VRAGLLAAALLAAAPAARASAADDLDETLAQLPAEATVTLRERISVLAAHDVGVAPLAQKLQEGLLKKVPQARLIAALEQIADNLLWADTTWATCRKPDAAAARATVHGIANELLLSGVAREALATVLASLCARADAGEELSRAADVYSHLRHRLSTPAGPAWSLVGALLVRGESEAAGNALVPVLNDIFRRRGSIERPLQVALTRLNGGASLRAVRNELVDQFLRD